MSPEFFRILTVDRGWNSEDYVAWVAGSLRDQLLGGSDAQAPRGPAVATAGS